MTALRKKGKQRVRDGVLEQVILNVCYKVAQ